MVNQTNFSLFTYANFQKASKKIDKWDFISKTGSKYKYDKQGVYRLSNHFSHKVSSCSWLLDNKEYISDEEVLGYCAWEDFIFKTTIAILSRDCRIIKELAIDSLNANQLKAMYVNCKVRSNYQNESFLKL